MKRSSRSLKRKVCVIARCEVETKWFWCCSSSLTKLLPAIELWTVDDVVEWLELLGLPQFAPVMKRYCIDGDGLWELGPDVLRLLSTNTHLIALKSSPSTTTMTTSADKEEKQLPAEPSSSESSQSSSSLQPMPTSSETGESTTTTETPTPTSSETQASPATPTQSTEDAALKRLNEAIEVIRQLYKDKYQPFMSADDVETPAKFPSREIPADPLQAVVFYHHCTYNTEKHGSRSLKRDWLK